jgi:1,2-diacylglycerol 3-alpha-glucosyltransferase
MNIVMMTNTYKPILGGLEKSVELFTQEFRKRGHRVIIVAPEYEGMEPEEDVIRIPAIQNFQGTGFSIQLPIPGPLISAFGEFKPDLIHSHHPFLIGDTALRMATKYNVPLVFTHHTLYEENVHYLPGNENAWKPFVIELSTGYANLADQVFAPSESVRDLLIERGVTTPIAVVPTGIWEKPFGRGTGKAFRKKFKIPPDSFVIGYLGRLAPEKNLEFITRAVAQFLKNNTEAYFMVTGKGPSEEMIETIFKEEGLSDKLYLTGPVQGDDVIRAYQAMNVFVFASQSETQGMVLTEAMAAGVPIVGVDAPGVREVIKDKINGRLLSSENNDDFIAALKWIEEQSPYQMRKIKKACQETARGFSMDISVAKALEAYVPLVIKGFVRRNSDENNGWAQSIRMIETQLGLVKNLTKAAGTLLTSETAPEETKKTESLSLDERAS